MTTKHSSTHMLTTQADRIADLICRSERGEPISVEFAEKLAEARKKESVTIGIVMDDKIIKIEIPWTTIRTCGHAGLSQFVFDQMCEIRRSIN